MTGSRMSASMLSGFAQNAKLLESTSDGAPLPILYGTVLAAGYISMWGATAGGDYVIRVVWGCGEVYQIKSVYINGALPDPDIAVFHYRGTPIQGVDSSCAQIDTVTGYADDLIFFRPAGRLGVCYSVFVIPAGSLDDAPRFQAIIDGTVLYDPREVFGNGDPFYDSVGFDLDFTGTNGTAPTTGVDQSGHANTVAWYGGATIQGNLLSLDGVNDYLTITDAAYTKPDSDKWTIELKAEPTTVAAGTYTILARGTPTVFCVHLRQVDDDLYLSLSSDGVTNDIANGVMVKASAFVANAERDLRLEFSGADYKVYVNGAVAYRIVSDLKVHNISNAWHVGHRESDSYYFTGTVRCLRFTRDVLRYGGDIVSSALPYADSDIMRPGYVFSDVSALCFNDLVKNPFYGYGAGVCGGILDAIVWNEEVVNSVPRCRLSLAITENRPISEWLDLLAMYAECFWFNTGTQVTLVPDRLVDAKHPTGWVMVENARFIDTSEPWDLTTGWTYSDFWGSVSRAGTGELLVTQEILRPFEPGVVYVLTIDISTIADGSVGLNLGAIPMILKQTVAGVYSIEYTATGFEDTLFTIESDADFDGSVSVASIHRKYWLEDSIVAGSFRVQGGSESGTPTKVSASYTMPSDTTPNWSTGTYNDAQKSGVESGYFRLVETALSLPGVFRVEEAAIKANTKLARMDNRIRYTWTSTDRGMALQEGTVVNAIEPSLGVDILALVESVTLAGYGRYNVTASNYSESHYPTDIPIPDDAGLIPVGAIVPLKEGAAVPSGWALWSTADGYNIKGAGLTRAVNSTGGSNSITIPSGEYTTDNGLHGALYPTSDKFQSQILSTGPGASTITIMTAQKQDGGGHDHQLTPSQVLTASPFARRTKLVQKTGSAGAFVPGDVQVFGLRGLVSPGMERAIEAAGRLLQAYNGHADVGTLRQTVTPTYNTADNTHKHYTSALTASRAGSSAVLQNNYADTTAGGVHTHTGEIELRHNIKRHAIQMYQAYDDYYITQGVVFGWPGALDAIPDGYTLMNGLLGTFDLDDLFIVISGNGGSDSDGSPVASNTARLVGTTLKRNDGGHKSTSFTTTDYVVEPVYHPSKSSHAHSVDTTISWQPPFYALAFIMYNPNPVPGYVDVGVLVAGGGVFTSTAIVDDGPDNLTPTISGAPTYDIISLFGLTSIFNTTGDRLNFPSFVWGGKFTLEGFFRLSNNATGVMMGNRAPSTAERFSLQYSASTGVQMVLDDAVVLTSADPGINAWYYVALCYDGAEWRFYYGLKSSGVALLVGSVVDVIASPVTASLYIGGSNTNTTSFLGNYGQIRHTRGVALYKKSAIMIPAEPFATE